MFNKIKMPPKLVELRPDRKLIQTNFDGYKLSLSPIPIIKKCLTTKPDKVQTNDDQYSFLHAQLFGLQNHLVRDLWCSGSTYFIDKDFNVQKIYYNIENGTLYPLKSVYKVPHTRDRVNGDYNTSLRFIGENNCILSNGAGSIFILETENRDNNTEWKLLFTNIPLDSDSGFLIQDARYEVIDNEKQIHCVLIHIEQNDNIFQTCLEWIKYCFIDNSWQQISRKQLKSKKSCLYCAIEPQCGALIVSSERSFKFTLDTENPIVDKHDDSVVKAKEEITSTNQFGYTWTQNDDDIVINFNENPDAEKSDYNIKCTDNRITVQCKSNKLIDEDIFGKIDSDLTTWSMQNQSLQLILIKKTSGLAWPFLIPDGPNETIDANHQQNDINLLNDPQPISNLGTQMEECDFGGDNGTENEYFIERLDSQTHETTHKIFLSSTPPIFSVDLSFGLPAAIALRHDVDTCIWQQHLPADSSNNNNWIFRHEGTLNAFGYVQASKKQKKFIQCSPDMNYVLICETMRHIFFYKNTYDMENCLLKKRNIGGSEGIGHPQQQIGQQKLIVLDNDNEIIGLTVYNNFTIILTENFYICLQIIE